MNCTALRSFSAVAAIAGFFFLSSGASAAPITLAKWTFETSVPSGTGSNNGPYAAEEGDNAATSLARGFHQNSATVWSNPAGNGSDESFSSNTWTIGDYYQFATSTLGNGGVQLSWAQTRSSTGPSDFDLQWSTDGTSFTTATSYVVGTTSFSSTTFKPEVVFNADLSSITTLNNQANVYFRLTATSAPSGTGGTNRVDDFTVQVPEPATLGLLMMAGVALAFRRRMSA